MGATLSLKTLFFNNFLNSNLPSGAVWCSLAQSHSISIQSLLHQICTKGCTTMASFSKRNGRWRAQIRRPGQKSLSKSFATEKEAKAWARDIESKMDKGQSVDA